VVTIEVFTRILREFKWTFAIILCIHGNVIFISLYLLLLHLVLGVLVEVFTRISYESKWTLFVILYIHGNVLLKF
jgi:hypothetical protein